ncbi:MAG: amidohydrolase family protein [Gammaproteobacteria bacterium]
MFNRRDLLAAAAAGAATAAFGSRAFAADVRYDLVIKGGRVIDPSLRLDGIRDLGIVQGRIAAVEPSIAAATAATIDARGKLVVPGLIDIHTHAARTLEGPGMVLADGVTGWIDAGSHGADGIDLGLKVARASPQQGRLLINVGRGGILPDGDTMDLKRADTGAMRAAIEPHRDLIVGIKARLTKGVTANDAETLRRAQEVATAFGLPVMIHMGQTESPLPQLLDLLKSGDIVTHLFAPPPNAIIDDAGKILPAVLAARRRGVWFDVGFGRVGHLRWDIVDKVLKAGFWPDTFSTDWNADSKTTGVVDLPNCMSKLFAYGMSVSEAVACVTVNAARTFPVFRDRGTLNVGAVADIALLELREGEFEFIDNYDNKIKAKQRLFPAGTVLAGKRV